MGWDQVGALGTLGCLLVAVITLVFVVKPLPWRKQDVPTVGKGASRKLVAFLVIVILVAFLLSGISIWSAWHPVSEYKVLPESEMEVVEGKQFVNEPIEIDGKAFRMCKFINVRFVVHGRSNATITHSQFFGPIVVTTDNPQAKAVMAFVVSLLRDGNLVDKQKVGFDNKDNVIIQGAGSTPAH